MGVEVKVALNPAALAEIATARRRGLLAAGEAILKKSSADAPYEEVPRHGVHLRDTGHVTVIPGAEEDSAAIGYDAYWAIWQHEKLEYHHTQGEAKFLERAMLSEHESALAMIAETIRVALA